MYLFSLAGIPAFTLFIVFFYKSANKEREFKSSSYPKGLLWCVLTLLFVVLFQKTTPLSYKTGALLVHFFLNEHLIFLLLGGLGFFFYRWMGNFQKNETLFIELVLFLGGYFSGVSLYYFVVFFGRSDLYILIMLPLIRMALIVLTAFLAEKCAGAFQWGKIPYILAFFVTPLVLSFLSVLFSLNHITETFILSFCVLAGSIVLHHFFKEA